MGLFNCDVDVQMPAAPRHSCTILQASSGTLCLCPGQSVKTDFACADADPPSDDDSTPQDQQLAGVTNIHMAHMASQIFNRLAAHSRFVPIMLDMTNSVLPLPEAAEKLRLQLPLTSILPLVSCRPSAQVTDLSQVVTRA